MKKKKAKSQNENARAPVRKRPTRKLTSNETKQMRGRARRRSEIELPPALDVSLPVAHGGTGHLVAETFLERNGAGILDIVAPHGTRIESWCSFARPARGKSRDWVVVSNHADDNGRLRVPVPRTHFYVWNFCEVPAEAEDGERIWRLHGHNVAFSGVGRDICWRVVLRLAPIGLPVAAKSNRPVPGARMKPVKRVKNPPKPVTIPVPA